MLIYSESDTQIREQPAPTFDEMPVGRWLSEGGSVVKTGYAARDFHVWTVTDPGDRPLLDAAFADGWGWHVSFNQGTRLWRAELQRWRGGRTEYMQLANLWLGPGEVDHIDPHCPLDNRRSNTRLVTSSQNNANRRLRSDNTSGLKGIGYDPRCSRPWHVQVQINARTIHRYAKSLTAAVVIRDSLVREHFGEHGRYLMPEPNEQPALEGGLNATVAACRVLLARYPGTES